MRQTTTTRRRTTRLSAAMAVVLGLALVAAACGGEVTDSADDDAAAPTTQAPTTQAPAPDDDGSDAPAPAADDDDDDDADDAPAPAADDDDDSDDAPAADETDDSDDLGDDEAEEPEPAEPEGPPPNIYDDPRDGMFDAYQATMDRSDHPFMQIDAACLAHEPAADRVASDRGIEADSISVVHIRSKLEDLAQIGFGTDVGDPAEMFETYVAYVNEQCGGIRGRMIDLRTIEVDVLGDQLDEQRNAACIEAIEDHDAVLIIATSGFQGSAVLCIVEANETVFITSQGLSDEFMERGEGRLVVMTPTGDEVLRWIALDLIGRGELDGKVIGIAAPDTPGQYEAVEAGLVNTLRENGANVAVFDKVGCGGTVACTEGAVETVGRFRAAGVDVVFNVFNVISSPLFLVEMLNQGYEPGDVQFYATDFNSQGAEIVASKVVLFGGKAAGDLYNGARILDARDTGAYRLEGYEPRAFNEMCNDNYGAYNPSGANHESLDRTDGNSRYGMASSICAQVRLAFRALYDAGDNPTRADIYAALANMGAVDTNEMVPGSVTPDKARVPDAIHNLVWEFPCTQQYPLPIDGYDGPEGHCIYPLDEFRPPPS